MADASAEEILSEIEELQSFFESCRAHFPRLTDDHIGLTHIPPVSHYVLQGLEISFSFTPRLTQDDIKRNNEIAHWINQNAAVRLCAIIEHHKIATKKYKLNESIEGYREVSLLCELRNIFAHKSGRYKPTEKHEKKFVRKLVAHFRLEIDNPEDFPPDISKGIDPIFEGCKSYVRGKLKVT
jgi:hypothetical protein